MVLWQQIFSILAMMIFLFRIFFKSASKSSFFCIGVEMTWSFKSLQFCGGVAYSSIVFCDSVCADRLTWEERAAVLLTFFSWIDMIRLSGSLGGACSCAAHVHGGTCNNFCCDLAVRYSGRSVQLGCSRSWRHV